MEDNQCIITDFIADNPKRAFARNSVAHAGKYACEYCFGKGEIAGGGQTNVVWPSSTVISEERTTEQIEDICNLLDVSIAKNSDELKGIKGPSELLTYPDFDYVTSIPTEYMHSVCIGLVKRLLELTFKTGKNRARTTTNKLADPSKYNFHMKKQKVPREFSRRSRSLDLTLLKAQEMRNICLFLFPIVVECMEPNSKEAQLWLLIAFCIRACILPDTEFLNVKSKMIQQSCEKFYSIYENLFGTHNCTYTIHIVCSHLLNMRKHGPLTDTSAFKFENFYAELRRSFVPGTVSPLKQMMQTVILKRILSSHICQQSIYISPNDTNLECNSLIYVYNEENKVHKCYKIYEMELKVYIRNYSRGI